MEGTLAEIRMFGGNFAPRGWALCEGQLLPIAQNQALFSLLGTTFGGDGRTTFALPDMRGRLAMGYGQGPGLSNRPLGQKTGAEYDHITVTTMPSHNHAHNITAAVTIGCRDDDTSATDDPTGNVYGNHGTAAYNASANAAAAAPTVTMTGGINLNGGSQWHNNLMPYQVVNFIIAMQGTFPSRN